MHARQAKYRNFILLPWSNIITTLYIQCCLNPLSGSVGRYNSLALPHLQYIILNFQFLLRPLALVGGYGLRLSYAALHMVQHGRCKVVNIDNTYSHFSFFKFIFLYMTTFFEPSEFLHFPASTDTIHTLILGVCTVQLPHHGMFWELLM